MSIQSHQYVTNEEQKHRYASKFCNQRKNLWSFCLKLIEVSRQLEDYINNWRRGSELIIDLLVLNIQKVEFVLLISKLVQNIEIAVRNSRFVHAKEEVVFQTGFRLNVYINLVLNVLKVVVVLWVWFNQVVRRPEFKT